jgi:N6-adenosine-specific RNA methylase IME4
MFSEQEMACEYCHGPFIFPITLDCGDSFCTECFNEMGRDAEEHGTAMKCPTCSRKCKAALGKRSPSRALMWALWVARIARGETGDLDIVLRDYDDIHVPYMKCMSNARTVAAMEARIGALQVRLAEMKRQQEYNAANAECFHFESERESVLKTALSYHDAQRAHARRVFAVGAPGGLPSDVYSIIMAPAIPWGGLENYPAKRTELEALPIMGIAAKDCAVIVGFSPSHIGDAIDLVKGWGFEPRTVLFQWAMNNVVKDNKQPKAYGKYKMRYYLAASIGNMPFLKEQNHRNFVNEVRTMALREHPTEFYNEARDKLEAFDYKVELFSVRRQPGWHCALPEFFRKPSDEVKADDNNDDDDDANEHSEKYFIVDPDFECNPVLVAKGEAIAALGRPNGLTAVPKKRATRNRGTPRARKPKVVPVTKSGDDE